MKTLFSAAAAVLLALPALAAPQKTVIRWVVAHDRGNTPFAALNHDFAKKLEAKSHGRLSIDFLPSSEAADKLDEAAFQKVSEGRADMSQLSASEAGAHALEMPYLFRSYEHAEAVLTGPVGRKLLTGVTEESRGKARALAFTYSGGYRMLAGKAVAKASDFRGLRARKSTSYLSGFLKELGASFVEAGPASRERPIDEVAAGRLDLEETEINRLALVVEQHPELAAKMGALNLTRHRMYLTALVVNEKFLAGLPEDLRELLISESEALAAAERKLSIELEKKNLAVLAKKGVRVVEISDACRKAMAEAGERLLAKTPALKPVVDEVRAVREPTKLARN
jgi:TRAP-type transport system periplasmic protein